MLRSIDFRRGLVLAAAVLALAGAAQAAEVRVMISGGFSAAYHELAPVFERSTGHTLKTTAGPSMGDTPEAIPNRIQRGEPVDVVIMVGSALDDLIHRSKVVADSRVDLARSRIGMVVRAGAPRPDIGSVEAFKRTVLAAKSIAYSDSASGVYLSQVLFPRLGIAAQVAGKSRMIPAEPVGAVVARGEAEIGFQQISELLPVSGIDLVGALPAELQKITVFSAGVAANANEPQAGRALIRFLSSSEAAPAIERSGLEPAGAAARPSLPSLTAGQAWASWSDRSPHNEAFVTVNGIRLQYLDWGGSGEALILIHGIGGNPHHFDDLAPAFTDRFHVIAYARRGHGRSDAEPPYDGDTLVEDLRGLMGALGIAKASLVGFSMGGDEITAMAAAHPERVDRLVYLDAAYDWADPAFVAAYKAVPRYLLEPPASVMRSLDAYRAYQRGAFFPTLKDTDRIEAFIRDGVLVQPDGSLKDAMDASAEEAATTTLLTYRRDYSRVHCPVLALYAVGSKDPPYADAVHGAEIRAWYQKYFDPFRLMSIERARRELSNVQIATVPGAHNDFFLVSRERVVGAMRRFLGADETAATSHHSGKAMPDPPISFGRSFSFGSPSAIRSVVSW